jgi:hypothetical protein
MTNIQKLIQATGYTEPTQAGKGKGDNTKNISQRYSQREKKKEKERYRKEKEYEQKTEKQILKEIEKKSFKEKQKQQTKQSRVLEYDTDNETETSGDEAEGKEEYPPEQIQAMKQAQSPAPAPAPAPAPVLASSQATQTEETAPGTLGKTGPSDITRSLMKSRDMVMSAVSSIITGYNGLVDYINLQNRQKPFKQSDVSSIDGLVKQLVDPLKSALAASSRLLESDTREAERDYTRVYNVISDMIKKILTGMPFIKVDIAMLNERIPLKYEYILSKEYDSKKQSNQQYLKSLEDMVKKEMTSLEKMPEQTPLEQEAKALMRQQMNRQLEQLVDAGLMKDSVAKKIVRDIKASFGPPSGGPSKDIRQVLGKPQERTVRGERGFVEVVDEEERKGPVEEGEEKALELSQSQIEGLDYDPFFYDVQLNIQSLSQINKVPVARKKQLIDNAYDLLERMGKDIWKIKDELKDKNKLQVASSLITELRGKGKPNRKKGGNVHKTEKFGDEQELEPYLTKHLRPSKYRKDVPPIESSSEESSGEEGSGSDMEINDMRLGKGKKKGRKARKQKEDVKAIANLPKAEAMVLIEKKRGGAKKKTEKAKVKPALQNSQADVDLWFM